MTSGEAAPAAVMADAAFPVLKDLVIGITGMAFYRDKDPDLARIVAARMSACGEGACGAYVLRLRHDRDEMDALISELTIGETYFFRHKEQFDALRDIILPAVIERNRPIRRLRIWSAGCATGPEPYSIAILLRHDFGMAIRDWHVSILGTDINQRFLARAREGVYDSWAFRAMPPDLMDACFTRQGRQWQIRSEYKSGVTFQYHNLITSPFPSVVDNIAGFDLIVCRNVIIYFSPETVAGLIPRFRGSLGEEGWLVMGHAEPNQELFRQFRTVNAEGAVLYQRRDGLRAEAPSLRHPVPHPSPVVPFPSAPARPLAAPPRSRRETAPDSQPQPQFQPVQASAARASLDMLARVRQLADSGCWDEAASLCDAMLAEAPLDARAQFCRALIHDQVGRMEDCEKALRRAIYLDRKMVLPHYHLGLFLLRRDDGGAGKAFRNVLSLLDGRGEEQPVADGEAITVGHLREAVEMHLKLIGDAT